MGFPSPFLNVVFDYFSHSCPKMCKICLKRPLDATFLDCLALTFCDVIGDLLPEWACLILQGGTTFPWRQNWRIFLSQEWEYLLTFPARRLWGKFTGYKLHNAMQTDLYPSFFIFEGGLNVRLKEDLNLAEIFLDARVPKGKSITDKLSVARCALRVAPFTN